MKRQILFLALAAALLVPATESKVQAWGAMHVGYTHVGYGGVQHYGATVARGPAGGVYGGAHYGSTGYGGYHYGATEYRGYSPSYSGGYATGGYHYGGAYGGAYGAGVYRAY